MSSAQSDREPPTWITCPQCRGAGRLYDTDEVGEPCGMCREDGVVEAEIVTGRAETEVFSLTYDALDQKERQP